MEYVELLMAYLYVKKLVEIELNFYFTLVFIEQSFSPHFKFPSFFKSPIFLSFIIP